MDESKDSGQFEGTWAPLFYEYVFCKIDEAPFPCLYCLDNGRPNFPVNILLSLELGQFPAISIHDQDVTYCKKASKGHVGLVLNIAETCADENPVQIITDYVVEKNRVGDAEMLEKRIPEIQATKIVNNNNQGGYNYEENNSNRYYCIVNT